MSNAPASGLHGFLGVGRLHHHPAVLVVIVRQLQNRHATAVSPQASSLECNTNFGVTTVDGGLCPGERHKRQQYRYKGTFPVPEACH